jgi:hypothetical protein
MALSPIDLVIPRSFVGVYRDDKDRPAKTGLNRNYRNNYAEAWRKHRCLIARLFRVKRAPGLAASINGNVRYRHGLPRNVRDRCFRICYSGRVAPVRVTR